MNNTLENDYLMDFEKIHEMIQSSQEKMLRKINNILIDLYWNIGKYVSEKITASQWGDNIVDQLSIYLTKQGSRAKGFSARNIWRMKKFYEAYKNQESLLTLLTEINWTNHLHILSKTKSYEEKEFYLQLISKHPYSEREFARMIDSGTFERTMLANQKLSAVLTEFPRTIKNVFKDTYFFEFTGVSENHSEFDLKTALIKHLHKFLLELGPDFSFLGEEYLIQVGHNDYRIDLLLHHRELNCLVAIELKIDNFKPEYLGKLQFYLEALDRNVKKNHENPSVGLLICKTKDDEIVQYAMSRNISPAVVAEYETKLINKMILQEKLHELSLLIN